MGFAYWRKCDFQVHSPRDPNWQGARPLGLGEDNGGTPATATVVDAARSIWAEDFVEQSVQRGLGAIAITDHHEMVMVPYVQSVIAGRKARDANFDLWLFPGMELTCRNGVQCLIIFDADLSEEWRREAQGLLGIVVAELEDKKRQAPRVTQLACTYPDIATKLDGVPQLRGRYIVLPNVSQGGQHTVLTDGAHADFKAMPYVGGYLDAGQTIDSLSNRYRKRLSGTDATWSSRFIYPLPTSDARAADYSSLGGNQCWIKLAEPTAEAIRQAFLGHQSRIAINDRPQVATLSIKSISVSGSAILANGTLSLSPELNSFIGGRGSGKSTLLEYVAYGLGRSCADIPKPEYSGKDRLTGLISDTLVSAGATLDVVVVQDGAEFRIRRGGASSYQPIITYPDGTTQELSLKELRSLFPAVVYSQGELSEIGKQAGRRAQLSDLLQFVDPEFKREDERLNAGIEAAKLTVRSCIQKLSSAYTQQSELHKTNASKASLEQRIAALQKTLPELSKDDQQVVDRHAKLVEFDAKRRQAENQVAAVMEELTQLWRTSRQPVDLTSPLPESLAVGNSYQAFNAAFSSGIVALGQELKVLSDDVVRAGTNVESALTAATIDRDKAMDKLTAHRAATTQISALQADLQALLKHIGDLTISLLPPDEKFSELQQAIDALKALVTLRAERTKQWADKIELLSSQRIQAQLDVDRNWSEIFDAMDTVAAKTRSQEGTRHRQIEDSLAKGVWPFLDAVRADCLAALRWKLMSSASGGDKPACDTLKNSIGATPQILDTCIDMMDLSRVEAIATAVPKPEITLFYCDNDRRISFEKASEGQRAAALLFMLLEQHGGPLLVDQPEGDLDNKIVSELADKLHTAKQKRQILFASHNANIVVNGSSELVIGMDITTDAKRAVCCDGAIDRSAVCDKITETMEGGEKAFRDRKEKYGY